MPEIPLTRGAVALVDEEDYEELSSHVWYCDSFGHAKRRDRGAVVAMHRVLLDGLREDQEVFHLNGNVRDNRKCNLVACVKQESKGNIRPRKGCTSKYKGVSKVLCRVLKKPWHAYITTNRHRRHLGYYECEEDAAIAYNKAAVEHFGKFARINEVSHA